MVEIPEPDLRDFESQFDGLFSAGSDGDGLRFVAEVRAVGRSQTGGDGEFLRFAGPVLKINRVLDLRRAFREIHVRTNLLTADEDARVFREPDIANHAAVVPPVVPDIAAGFQLQSQARNAGFRRAIVELYGDKVFSRLEQLRDIEEIGGVAALVFAGFRAVYPHAGGVEGRAEVKLDVGFGSARQEIESAEIPGDAFIVLVLANVP